MTRRSVVWALVMLALGAAVAYGVYWWMHRTSDLGIPSGEELLARVPTDLIPMVGTIVSADANGIVLVTEQYVESPSGRYLAQQEHRFLFDPDTNIFMTLRTPTPGPSPSSLGEESAVLDILIDSSDLVPGTSAVVLYSAADQDPTPVAWRVVITEP